MYHFQYQKRKSHYNIQNLQLWDFSIGLKNEFETAVENEALVFKPLKVERKVEKDCYKVICGARTNLRYCGIDWSISLKLRYERMNRQGFCHVTTGCYVIHYILPDKNKRADLVLIIRTISLVAANPYQSEEQKHQYISASLAANEQTCKLTLTQTNYRTFSC